MNIIKIIIDACYKIFAYNINLFGYQISLLNVFCFAVILLCCFKIIRFLLS